LGSVCILGTEFALVAISSYAIILQQRGLYSTFMAKFGTNGTSALEEEEEEEEAEQQQPEAEVESLERAVDQVDDGGVDEYVVAEEDDGGQVPFDKRIYTTNKFWRYVDDYLNEARTRIRKNYPAEADMAQQWTQ
jgi:hypothetical protein